MFRCGKFVRDNIKSFQGRIHTLPLDLQGIFCLWFKSSALVLFCFCSVFCFLSLFVYLYCLSVIWLLTLVLLLSHPFHAVAHSQNHSWAAIHVLITVPSSFSNHQFNVLTPIHLFSEYLRATRYVRRYVPPLDTLWDGFSGTWVPAYKLTSVAKSRAEESKRTEEGDCTKKEGDRAEVKRGMSRNWDQSLAVHFRYGSLQLRGVLRAFYWSNVHNFYLIVNQTKLCVPKWDLCLQYNYLI